MKALHAPQIRNVAVVGHNTVGKTTLVAKVIPRIIARGLAVSTLKHAHHGFDVDPPPGDRVATRARLDVGGPPRRDGAIVDPRAPRRVRMRRGAVRRLLPQRRLGRP